MFTESHRNHAFEIFLLIPRDFLEINVANKSHPPCLSDIALVSRMLQAKTMFNVGENLPAIRVHGGREGASLSSTSARMRSPQSAFTLVEVMVGITITAVMSVALYAGIGVAFSQLRLSRENLRATQILEGKMEIVRQYNWDQVANIPNFVPATFKEPFFANNPTNTPGNFVYTGQVSITNAPITESYSNYLKMITIKLTWKSGSATHKRQATTFVSQYGLQRYVY